MVPSSLLGLLLFLFLLAPGLAYVLRHEHVVPAREQSAFRESLRVIFVSAACLIVTGLALTALRWKFPQDTPDIGGLVRHPEEFARTNYVALAWWGLAYLVVATLLGALAADPRVVRALRWLRSTDTAERILGKTDISHASAWRWALRERRAVEARQRKIRNIEVLVGLQMTDGTYIRGYLVSYNPKASDDEEREIILTGTEIRPKGKGKVLQPIASTLTVISAKLIARMDVTYVNRPERSPRHSTSA